MHEKQSGDILLFYNAGGLARVITWVTRSPFYHVAIYAGNNHVVEARLPGVIQRDITNNYYLVIPAPQGKGPAALEWAKQQLGDDYAVLQVLVNSLDRIVFRLPAAFKRQNNRFSCTELVDAAFMQVGVDLLPERRPEGLLPVDFVGLLPKGEEISRGSTAA